MVSFDIDGKFLTKIDYFVQSSKTYKSRSEFFKDAARKNLERELEAEKRFQTFVEETERLRKAARAKGWKPTALTLEKKDEIARKYIKEHGIKLQ